MSDPLICVHNYPSAITSEKIAEVARVLEINKARDVLQDGNEMVLFDLGNIKKDRRVAVEHNKENMNIVTTNGFANSSLMTASTSQDLENKKENIVSKMGSPLAVPIELSYWQKSEWLDEKGDRTSAEEILAFKPTGTFLVRRSSLFQAKGHYALTLVCNGIIYHCLIEKDEAGSYGFTCNRKFPSLEHLIHHYRFVESLMVHNMALNTYLKTPAFVNNSNSQHIMDT